MTSASGGYMAPRTVVLPCDQPARWIQGHTR
jgi:hypothetical protein